MTTSSCWTQKARGHPRHVPADCGEANGHPLHDSTVPGGANVLPLQKLVLCGELTLRFLLDSDRCGGQGVKWYLELKDFSL